MELLWKRLEKKTILILKENVWDLQVRVVVCALVFLWCVMGSRTMLSSADGVGQRLGPVLSPLPLPRAPPTACGKGFKCFGSLSLTQSMNSVCTDLCLGNRRLVWNHPGDRRSLADVFWCCLLLYHPAPPAMGESREKWHNSVDVEVFVLPKSLLGLQPVVCFSPLTSPSHPAGTCIWKGMMLCVAPGSKHSCGQVLRLLGLVNRGFGETPCGCPGCGEQEGFGGGDSSRDTSFPAVALH